MRTPEPKLESSHHARNCATNGYESKAKPQPRNPPGEVDADYEFAQHYDKAGYRDNA